VRAQVVHAVQAETFRQLLAAIEKGEKVIIPEFGVFSRREVEEADGQPAKKVIRFKVRASEGEGKAGKTGKSEARKQKRAEAKAAKTHAEKETAGGSGA
jgi:hypothetical protein